MFELTDAIAGRAGELDVPVFLALSADDQVIDSAAATRYFEGMPDRATRLRTRTMDRAGHVLPVDYGWRELAEKIARFAHAGE